MSKIKTCTKCKKLLPLENFHISKKTRDGLKCRCKNCRSEDAKFDRNKNKEKYLKKEAQRRIRNKESIRLSRRKYHQKTKDKRFAYRLEQVYGITITDYDNMYLDQNESCAVCFIEQDKLHRRLCVDHCHTSGKVRGLLCDKCNRMLGQINDKIKVLKSAINYLKKHHPEQDLGDA